MDEIRHRIICSKWASFPSRSGIVLSKLVQILDAWYSVILWDALNFAEAERNPPTFAPLEWLQALEGALRVDGKFAC